MEKVTVDKSQLLEKLNANKTDHRRIFEEALEGFKSESVAQLQRQIDDLNAGLRRDISIRRPVPVDHTRDYDRAIEMITMSIGDTITLSEEDFAKYVMDDWGWQGQFLSNTYGSATARTKYSDFYEVS